MNLSAKFYFFLFFVVIILIIPIFSGPYFLHVMIMIFFYAFLGQSWNILGGLCGQLSLCHGIFFGIGAYTSSLMFINMGVSPWIGLFLGGTFSSIIGIIISFPVFHYRLSGAYYALVTLAYGTICEGLAIKMDSVGGATGLLIPFTTSSLLLFIFQYKTPYYYISFCLMAISIGITFWVKKSRLGYLLLAIKEDEDAADALGVNILKYKLIASALSAFLTGMGGVFYAQYIGFIDPHTTLSIVVSVEILLRPIIGGTGSLLGPIVGSFILTPLSEITRVILGSGKSGVHLMVYGIFLILVCLIMPRGVFVESRDFFERVFLSKRSEGGETDSTFRNQ